MAYIVKAYRSPVGRSRRGSLKNYRSDDLAVEIINHMMDQCPEIDRNLVDDVIVGCANPEGEQGLQIGYPAVPEYASCTFEPPAGAGSTRTGDEKVLRSTC